MKCLGESLKYNNRLRVLYAGRINDISVGYNNAGSEGAKYISEALKYNKTLSSLYFGILTFIVR